MGCFHEQNTVKLGVVSTTSEIFRIQIEKGISFFEEFFYVISNFPECVNKNIKFVVELKLYIGPLICFVR